MAADFNGMMNGGGTSIPTPNIFSYPSEKCDECGHEVFVPGLIFKLVPGVMLGQGASTVPYPIKVACCAKCGALSPLDKKMYAEEEKKAKEAEKMNNKGKSDSGLII